MLSRKRIIENLFQNMYALRHKLLVGYHGKKQIAITPSQACVLRFVAENASVNVKTIAQALHISSSATTQLIDGLVDKGYLVRKNNAEDRRAIAVSLSQKAQKLLHEFKEQGLEKMTQIFRALNDEELSQYYVLNKKIMQSIQEKQS